MYACADAGIIMTPLNTRWSVDESRHAVVDCGIKVMAVLDRELLRVAQELSLATTEGPGISWLLLGPHALVSPVPSAMRREARQWRMCPVGNADHDAHASMSTTDVGKDSPSVPDGSFCHDLAEGVSREALGVTDTEDVFCIVHTSGSTGRSKGVALTHLGQVRLCAGFVLPFTCYGRCVAQIFLWHCCSRSEVSCMTSA